MADGESSVPGGGKSSPVASEAEHELGHLQQYVPGDLLDVSFPVSVRGYERGAVDACRLDDESDSEPPVAHQTSLILSDARCLRIAGPTAVSPLCSTTPPAGPSNASGPNFRPEALK
jgi:hypothetical protein